jgi:hypothetical protein
MEFHDGPFQPETPRNLPLGVEFGAQLANPSPRLCGADEGAENGQAARMTGAETRPVGGFGRSTGRATAAVLIGAAGAVDYGRHSQVVTHVPLMPAC